MANLILGETSFTDAFEFRERKRKKYIFLMQKWHMYASINSLKILKFTSEEISNYL